MRRTVLFLAVLFMTVPAMAVSNVDITCTADGNEVTVDYNSSENLIRAFGLDITITTTDANIIKVVPVDANYRIYPGQIVIVDGEVTDYNTPYAPGDLGDANVTVEMGSLYTWDPCYASDQNMGYGMEPNTSGTLLKFYVDASCNYAVTENAVVGGIVMENPDEEAIVTTCSGSVEVLCTVPYVVGDANLVAQATIAAAKLQVGNITTDCNDNIADGNVISTNPAGGVEVACGSSVDMVVSTGPCVECACCGDLDRNGLVQYADIGALTGLIDTFGVRTPPPFGPMSIGPTDVANWDPCADVDGNGLMQYADIAAITGWLDTWGVRIPPPFGPMSIECGHAYGDCP